MPGILASDYLRDVRHVLSRARLPGYRAGTDAQLSVSAADRFSTADLIRRGEYAAYVIAALCRAVHLPDLRAVLTPNAGAFDLSGVLRLERSNQVNAGIYAKRRTWTDHLDKESAGLKASASHPVFVFEGCELHHFSGSDNAATARAGVVMGPRRAVTPVQVDIAAGGAITQEGGDLSAAHVGTILTAGAIEAEILSVTSPTTGTVDTDQTGLQLIGEVYVPAFTQLPDSLRTPVVHYAAMLCYASLGGASPETAAGAALASSRNEFLSGISAFRRGGFDLRELKGGA